MGLSLKSIPYPGILCSEQNLDTALLILPAIANLLAHEIRAVQYNLKEGVDQLASHWSRVWRFVFICMVCRKRNKVAQIRMHSPIRF